MSLVVVGLNHRTASLDVREKLHFELGEKPLQTLLGRQGVSEAVILSTCNRVELSCVVAGAKPGVEVLTSFMSEYHQLSSQQIAPSLYVHTAADAVRHIFRVAASLDSMVIGEPQILSQVKQAYQYSLDHGGTGFVLNRVYPRAFFVAKRVRRETNVGRASVSVSLVAVKLAERIFEKLGRKRILLVGTGKMGALAAKHLVQKGVSDIILCNRTPERADQLLHSFPNTVERLILPLQELERGLSLADIAIFAAGRDPASAPLVSAQQMSSLMRRRKQRPLFIIDIAVPRNVDPQIDRTDNIYLYDVDDLQEIAEENREKRQAASDEAAKIIDAEVYKFDRWLKSLKVFPTIQRLKERLSRVSETEKEKVLRKLSHLSKEDQEWISRLGEQILNKVLHPSVEYIKWEASLDKFDAVELIEDLFALYSDPPEEKT